MSDEIAVFVQWYVHIRLFEFFVVTFISVILLNEKQMPPWSIKAHKDGFSLFF